MTREEREAATRAQVAGEFDFEENNAKFHRDDIASEIAKLKVSDEGKEEKEEVSSSRAYQKVLPDTGDEDHSFYDKKSFFDDISCEAKERADRASNGYIFAHQSTNFVFVS